MLHQCIQPNSPERIQLNAILDVANLRPAYLQTSALNFTDHDAAIERPGSSELQNIPFFCDQTKTKTATWKAP